jgi:hypothetical protein
LHDECVDVLQPKEKFIGTLRRTVPPGRGCGRTEGAQNVMRVFVAAFNDLAVEDDRFGFFDFECRTFDVVGEIRLEEREILACGARGCGILDVSNAA